MIQNKKTAAEGILFAVFIVIALLCVMLLPAHGATSTSTKKSAIGNLSYQTNPFTYKEGTVTAVAYVRSSGHSGLVVRIQPRATYMLFTEDILICGEPVELFLGKQNPLVLTYETIAHTSVEEVGCHRLVSVDEVKSSKGDLR